MSWKNRIAPLVALGEVLSDTYTPAWERVLDRTQEQNPWFTKKQVRLALEAIRLHFLDREALSHWLSAYDYPSGRASQSVGIVMAGNIPLAGFHDWLCTWVSGHKSQVRLSEKDNVLFPHLMSIFEQLVGTDQLRTEVVSRLSQYDAVIATGSNNTAKYFDYYFGRGPHIIRHSRSSVAVLSGEETSNQLQKLADDVFQYFGLGCRSITTLLVPKSYDWQPLQEAFKMYDSILNHHKYRNNYDYHLTLLLMNQTPYLEAGPAILIEDAGLQARISNVHYSYYDKRADVIARLRAQSDNIQCVSTNLQLDLEEVSVVPIGQAQQPKLWDYADGVDTLRFLL